MGAAGILATSTLALLVASGCATPRERDGRGAAENGAHAPPPSPDASMPEAPGPRAPAAWEGARECESNGGTWRIRFRTEPDPIATNEPFALEAWVFSADDPAAPRADVQLSIGASMPEHGHGMNREPRVAREEGGRFAVRGLLFHMPGRWELDFDVTRGAVTERAQLDLELE